MTDERICKCGHLWNEHRLISRESLIKILVDTDNLFLVPDRIGYLDETGNFFSLLDLFD